MTVQSSSSGTAPLYTRYIEVLAYLQTAWGDNGGNAKINSEMLLVLEEAGRLVHGGHAQPPTVPRADEDKVKDLVMKHCTVNQQKVLLRTVWKDGIDIERPRACIMNIADDLMASSLSSTEGK